MRIIQATDLHFDAIWPIFTAVVQTGQSYVYSPSTSKTEAYDIWMTRPIKTFVVLNDDEDVIGTYYIKENRPDLGSHVCRCGFMVDPNIRRQGVGEAMCKHAIDTAKSLGFRGMQLGYVVSTNTASVNLWKKMGFTEVGRVPNAFQHQSLGDVDVLIMYQALAN